MQLLFEENNLFLEEKKKWNKWINSQIEVLKENQLTLNVKTAWGHLFISKYRQETTKYIINQLVLSVENMQESHKHLFYGSVYLLYLFLFVLCLNMQLGVQIFGCFWYLVACKDNTFLEKLKQILWENKIHLINYVWIFLLLIFKCALQCHSPTKL